MRLDGAEYSPAVLERLVFIGGTATSFPLAAKAFTLLTDLKVSSRTINNKTIAIGSEMKAARDELTDKHLARPVTQPPRVAEPAVDLAVVQIDGGRIQTRSEGRGVGVHQPHWRESKNAGFYRMTGDRFDEDPQASFPACFTDPRQMSGLLAGSSELVDQEAEHRQKPDLSWRPVSLVRSVVSSLCDSSRLGQLMSAEAERRGFYTASRRAFLGDGLSYNWKIQGEHFETFTPVLDFIHPIERLHETSRLIYCDPEEAWQHSGKWIELVWQGDVTEVIGLLRAELSSLPESDSGDADEVRAKLSETIGYLENNVSRMDYPSYRRAGLPTTSCLIESLVKEINHRTKGSEKFWDDGPSGEAILHLAAALLSDGDQLANHMSGRPGRHYTRESRKDRQLAMT